MRSRGPGNEDGQYIDRRERLGRVREKPSCQDSSSFPGPLDRMRPP